MEQERSYDLFISYAHADTSQVQDIEEHLFDCGYDVWVDYNSIRIGHKWRDEIRLGIRASKVFIVVVTPNSAGSIEVKKEIDEAHRQDKTIVPLILGDGMEDLAVDPKHGVDFRNVRRTVALDALVAKLEESLSLKATRRPPRADLPDILAAGDTKFSTLKKSWRYLTVRGQRNMVAVQYMHNAERMAAYLVGPADAYVKAPRTVQVFLQFTGVANDTTFDDYLAYLAENRIEVHTLLIRGPQEADSGTYKLPEDDRTRDSAWGSALRFVQDAVNTGKYGAERLAFYLNTPNALSFRLGSHLNLGIDFEVYHYTEHPRQDNMYVKVYTKHGR